MNVVRTADKPMTLKSAIETLAKARMVIRNTGDDYRVNFANGNEATACYESDVRSAVDTALAMRKRNPDG